MIQRVQSLSYHYEGRLELHVIGGFSDLRRLSQDFSVPLLRKFNYILNAQEPQTMVSTFDRNLADNLVPNLAFIFNFFASEVNE